MKKLYICIFFVKVIHNTLQLLLMAWNICLKLQIEDSVGLIELALFVSKIYFESPDGFKQNF